MGGQLTLSLIAEQLSIRDRNFVDVQVENAIAKTRDYIEAHPEMTTAELLGGAYIIPEDVDTLPDELPYRVVPDEPVTEFTEVPARLRNYVTVEILTDAGADIRYQASFPELANRRITLSYEAATPADQRFIDRHGGTLLNTPPRIDLVPVLRVQGEEVARGTAAGMGTLQTRRLTFTDANGDRSTVRNIVRVGEIFALGLAYGRTSAAAVAASQKRLAEARAAIPTNDDGVPDAQAPENMAEPVIGESLHLALQTYFNQLDMSTELVARKRHIRWFRGLSAGIATQDMAFTYLFGVPLATLGGGMSFDIQQNDMAVTSLRHDANDERAFTQTAGVFGSALENSSFENLGFGAVSTVRLFELALGQGIPVYRIDSANKAQVFPLLQLDAATESSLEEQIDKGFIVTVPEEGHNDTRLEWYRLYRAGSRHRGVRFLYYRWPGWKRHAHPWRSALADARRDRGVCVARHQYRTGRVGARGRHRAAADPYTAYHRAWSGTDRCQPPGCFF